MDESNPTCGTVKKRIPIMKPNTGQPNAANSSYGLNQSNIDFVPSPDPAV